MRILIVVSSLPPHLGGVERVTSNLAGTLTKKHSVFFAYYGVDDKEVNNKIKIDLNSKQSLLLLEKFIISNDIEIIINQDIYSKYLLELYRNIKLKTKVKLINCFHVSPDFYKYRPPVSLRSKVKNIIFKLLFGYDKSIHLRRRMYEICDAFTLLSESFLSDFIKLYKVKDQRKLVAIPNQLPDITVSDVPKQKVFLIVCRMDDKQKNIKSALRIWKQVQDKNSHDWKLIIVGGGGDLQMLTDYANKLELLNVFFEGHQTDVNKYYRFASYFIMTSHYEGFGMTLIEAQQHKCVPIVFDNFSVLHDIIKDASNGFIISSGDEHSFANKIGEVIQHPEIYTPLATQAKLDCQRFSPTRISARWESLFLNNLE